jgi:hypothetical protein
LALVDLTDLGQFDITHARAHEQRLRQLTPPAGANRLADLRDSLT